MAIQLFKEQMHFISNEFIYLELFFILIIIISAFLIFYKTKEIYCLTEHKGIKFFRKGFLFFGIGHLLILLGILFRLEETGFNFMKEILQTVLFFNLIGLSYLLSSIYSNKIKEYYIYLFSIIIFTLSIITETKFLLMFFSLFLIFSLGIISYKKIKNSKKKVHKQIYIIYFIIFLSWIFSIFTKLISNIYLSNNLRFLNEMIMAITFLYILYRVIKKLQVE